MSVRASLSLGCEEAPLGGVSEDYLTELTVEFRKTVRQSPLYLVGSLGPSLEA